jgi:arginase
VIPSPYHDGLEEVERGRGPALLLDAVRSNDRLSVEKIGPVDPAQPEAARVFAVATQLAQHVRSAIREGAFPLVLAGDCNSCLGTVAGCEHEGLGIVWLDAHADIDTPENSSSGSLDAMGLAMLTGHGWRALRGTVPGLNPIDEARVVLVGARAFEPGQRSRLRESRMRVLEGDRFSNADLQAALDHLRARAPRLYLHIDLDALDPRDGIANHYSVPGGLSSDRVASTVAEAFRRFDVAAAAITAYDPETDRDGRMLDTAVRTIGVVAGCRARQPSLRHPVNGWRREAPSR